MTGMRIDCRCSWWGSTGRSRRCTGLSIPQALEVQCGQPRTEQCGQYGWGFTQCTYWARTRRGDTVRSAPDADVPGRRRLYGDPRDCVNSVIRRGMRVRAVLVVDLWTPCTLQGGVQAGIDRAQDVFFFIRMTVYPVNRADIGNAIAIVHLILTDDERTALPESHRRRGRHCFFFFLYHLPLSFNVWHCTVYTIRFLLVTATFRCNTKILLVVWEGGVQYSWPVRVLNSRSI